MELVRMGGTSSGDTTAVASTRPSASKVSTVCAPSTRRAAASKVASASAVDSIGGRGAAGVVDIVGELVWPWKGEMVNSAAPESVASEALIVARSQPQASARLRPIRAHRPSGQVQDNLTPGLRGAFF